MTLGNTSCTVAVKVLLCVEYHLHLVIPIVFGYHLSLSTVTWGLYWAPQESHLHDTWEYLLHCCCEAVVVC